MDRAHETTVNIRLEGISVAKASSAIMALRDHVLLEADRSVEAHIVWGDDPTHQDFGETLVLFLGAQTATAVAKVIASWFAREGGEATLSMDIGGGEVFKFKSKSADVDAIARALAAGPAQAGPGPGH
jgi:hypothetical protein